MRIETLKYYIQSANVNFLYGSGLSRPYLSVLGNIEKWLTELYELRQRKGNNTKFSIVEASILKQYFDTVISPNLTPTGKEYDTTITQYRRFLSIWNGIINKRNNSLISKQINLFTTNVDILLERAAMGHGVELNDGFQGSIEQVFEEDSFQKTISKTSLHFQNVTDIPVFNLIKIHGSINWREEGDYIKNDIGLESLTAIKTALEGVDKANFVRTTKTDAVGNIFDRSLTEMLGEAEDMFWVDTKDFDSFFDAYHKLVMINPTKRKFKDSVVDHHFYELMRQYSNNLEKENTLLVVSGFSFADEHISDITLRAANTNPTLQVIVFAFSDSDGETIKANLKLSDICLHNNILILTPSVFKSLNGDSRIEKYKSFASDVVRFDFSTINNLFELISQGIVTYGK